MIQYVVKAVQFNEKPINDISAAIQSLEMTTQIQDLISTKKAL